VNPFPNKNSEMSANRIRNEENPRLPFIGYRRPGTSLRYNLVLVCNSNMSTADFVKIGHAVRELAPDIAVFVGQPAGLPSYVLPDRPTLIFSPQRLPPGSFPRGKIYCGRPIPKVQQMRTFAGLGMAVPRWAIIKPQIRYTSEVWGPVVVTKPDAITASLSRGVVASRPEDVSYRPPDSFPAGHPGRLGPMLIQQFINTGLHPAQIRVLTLFGQPLYAEEIKSEAPQPMPKVLTPEGLSRWVITPLTVDRVRAFVYDEDVLRLAKRAYVAFPDIPLQACDILREASTGSLYILEINAGGNTWHFSSKWGQFQRVEGRKRDEQFQAFELAAKILIERTRSEAV
jgi:hypothetical protein